MVEVSNRVRVHTLANRVAVLIEGGQTMYLSRQLAQELASMLLEAAREGDEFRSSESTTESMHKTWFPIRQNGGMVDTRYKIELEWCGCSTMQYVVRFCDIWVGSSWSLTEAKRIAIEYEQERMKEYRK